MSRGSRKPGAVPNAADPRAVREAEKREKNRARQRADAYKQLLDLPAGRLVLWDLLDGTNVFATTFDTNGARMAFNEGQRNVGLRVLATITDVRPDAFLLMQREAADRART